MNFNQRYDIFIAILCIFVFFFILNDRFLHDIIHNLTFLPALAPSLGLISSNLRYYYNIIHSNNKYSNSKHGVFTRQFSYSAVMGTFFQKFGIIIILLYFYSVFVIFAIKNIRNISIIQ